jgi:Flp pilus assembly protein TadG
MKRGTFAGSERGAVLVHVAIALMGLIALSAFVVDYGVMWASRRQAQNSADAGALAAAVSMGFVDMNNQGLARTAAIDAARANQVWGTQPDITNADVTFPVCPPGSPGAGSNACVRVDVYRNQTRGNPLPTFFGPLANVNEQGVRATATAEVLFGDSTDCVKPWAIPDKWIERRNDQGPPGFDDLDTFEHYQQNGNNRGQPLNPFDLYEPPNGAGNTTGPNGTGYTRDSVTLGGSDYGDVMTLKTGNPHNQVSPGWFQPVVINPSEGPGAPNYRDNIATCDPTVIGPGTVLQVEPGNMIGPTRMGMAALIAQDPGAFWNQSLNGNRGGIDGGCMHAGTCAMSPRVVAIPLYNPDVFNLGMAHGRTDITVIKILGFFMERMQGNDVVGRIIAYPGQPRGGTSNTPGAAFVISVALVR